MASPWRKSCLMTLLLLLSVLVLSSSVLPADAAGNFSVKITPGVVDISPGIPGYFSIQVTSLLGFHDAVYFDLLLPEGFPSTPAYSFEPNGYVIPPANGFGYCYLKMEIPSTVATSGEYTLTVKAWSGKQAVSSSIAVRISSPPDNFVVSTSPPSQTVSAGGATSFAIYLQEIGSIPGQVTLVAYDFPYGVAVKFTPRSAHPAASSTMRLDTSDILTTGTYYLAIGGEFGGMRHTSIVSLIVTTASQTDFDFAIQPMIQYIAPGMSTAYTIFIISKGGFSSTVDLSLKEVPNNVRASLSARTVTVPAYGIVYSILEISSNKSAPTGTFTILVAGSSGIVSDSISAVLTITTTSQFAIAISPSSQTTAPGGSAKYDVTINSIGEFSSEISLDLDSFPGITFGFDPQSVKPAPSKPAKSVLTVTAQDKADAGTYTLIAMASSKKPDVTQYSSATLIITRVADFAVVPSVSIQSVVLGEAMSFSLTISSLGGFSSDVRLDLASPPSGIGYSFDPFSVRPSPMSPATSTLKISTTSDAKVGIYELTIVASSAGMIHSSAVSLMINPVTSHITVSVSPTAVKQGSTITASGAISSKTEGSVVTLTYTKPDGTTFTRTVKTNPDGGFSDSYAPEDIGTWQVYASWQGDESHTGARSTRAGFQVSELPFVERYGLVLGAGVVILIALGAVFYARGRRAPRGAAAATEAPAPEKGEVPPLAPPTKRCYNCGEVISAQARFCDKCRAPQP